MDTALFIGMTHKGALKREMEVLAHNVANMNTTAFKQEKVVFQQLLVDAPSAPGTDGGQVSYVVDKGVTRDFSAGAMVNTGNSLDVFISDNGFLEVEAGSGEKLYTRNGRMRLDQDLTLVTLSGQKVLDDTGAPVIFDASETDITIAENGMISTSQGEKATLSLVSFGDPNALKRRDNSLYESSQDPQGPEEGPEITLVPGAIEASNVDPIKSMVELIDISAAYARASKSGEDMEKMQKEAIQRLGRTR